MVEILLIGIQTYLLHLLLKHHLSLEVYKSQIWRISTNVFFSERFCTSLKKNGICIKIWFFQYKFSNRSFFFIRFICFHARIIVSSLNIFPFSGRQSIDWAKNGTIAAIYDGEVHFWHPTKTLKHQFTETNKSVRDCIKWNETGTLLAMAKRGKNIAIWDFELCKVGLESKYQFRTRLILIYVLSLHYCLTRTGKCRHELLVNSRNWVVMPQTLFNEYGQ